MNERIRELESQCWERRSHPNAQAAMGDRFNTKKFAELIIEECIDYCGENLSKTVGHALKIHFGVESDDDEYDDEVEYCPKCNEEWSGTSCGIDDCGWIVGVE